MTDQTPARTTGHTPGPWIRSYHGFNVLTANGEMSICELVSRGNRDLQIANASLIAAAPDLLAACEEVQQALNGLGIFDGVAGIENTLLGRVNAAIAKATGKEPTNE